MGQLRFLYKKLFPKEVQMDEYLKELEEDARMRSAARGMYVSYIALSVNDPLVLKIIHDGYAERTDEFSRSPDKEPMRITDRGRVFINNGGYVGQAIKNILNTLPNWINVAIALLALIVSVRSCYVADKALKISTKQVSDSTSMKGKRVKE